MIYLTNKHGELRRTCGGNAPYAGTRSDNEQSKFFREKHHLHGFFYIVSLDCPGVTNKLQGFRVVDGDFDQETVDICSQTIGFF